ncbi:hypothetical protein PR003_g16921 [Phytophthora rubi]|uniref:Secreted protein n=1 Tax=Phytophthora rubi TaxID=129364 RepID=A0A6A4EUZ9_9STRA|nr:hypothetical protein PR001_g16291 [Phytophthora rubi]KAE9012824.1 hypothetical protein PR002_g14693 [Phytophthora rubi]KAE9323693.1 hypothetical protein PR003_g16921 [Phytophthora rubi]
MCLHKLVSLRLITVTTVVINGDWFVVSTCTSAPRSASSRTRVLVSWPNATHYMCSDNEPVHVGHGSSEITNQDLQLPNKHNRLWAACFITLVFNRELRSSTFISVLVPSSPQWISTTT